MTIFHHPFTDIEKLSIVTPFEPDKFSSISRPRITLHIGGQRRRKIFSQSISDQMPDAGRKILKKWSSKSCLSSPLQEIWVSKSKVKMLESEPQKNVKEKWIEKKKKRVEMKMKRNKEGRSKQNWFLTWWKMILGLITLKHSLDLLILSFGTLNPSLHYML